MSKLLEIAPVGATVGPYIILTKAYQAGNGLWFVAVRVDGQLKTVRASDVIESLLGGKPVTTRKREFPVLYRVWVNMRRRCYHPWSSDYHWYGARGIRICADWVRSFDAFAEFAIAHGWRPDLTIDRIRNTDGDYEPRNVRFVDRRTQARNRSGPARTLDVDGLNRLIAQTTRGASG